MKIEHLAIWVKDLEKMKSFYEKYFQAEAGEMYHNPKKNFHSYFLSFSKGCRLELMQRPDIPENKHPQGSEYTGLIHFAISVGSESKVDELTAQMRSAGYTIAGNPPQNRGRLLRKCGAGSGRQSN